LAHAIISHHACAGRRGSISHQVYAAGAVLTVLLAVVGFFMNKIWDGLVVLMKTAPTH
jgi:hypothetical protein